jgi:hypothetical protein
VFPQVEGAFDAEWLRGGESRVEEGDHASDAIIIIQLYIISVIGV